MKAALLGLIVASMLVAVPASAGVNCEQVRRYLKTGRSPEEIAESMVIDVSDVKKCQEQSGEKAAQPPPAPTPKQMQ